MFSVDSMGNEGEVSYITKRLRGIEEERQDKEPGSWLESSSCVALNSGAR